MSRHSGVFTLYALCTYGSNDFTTVVTPANIRKTEISLGLPLTIPKDFPLRQEISVGPGTVLFLSPY